MSNKTFQQSRNVHEMEPKRNIKYKGNRKRGPSGHCAEWRTARPVTGGVVCTQVPTNFTIVIIIE